MLVEVEPRVSCESEKGDPRLVEVKGMSRSRLPWGDQTNSPTLVLLFGAPNISGVRE